MPPRAPLVNYFSPIAPIFVRNGNPRSHEEASWHLQTRTSAEGHVKATAHCRLSRGSSDDWTPGRAKKLVRLFGG